MRSSETARSVFAVLTCLAAGALSPVAHAQVASDSCQTGLVTSIVVNDPFTRVNANNLSSTPSLPGTGASGCSIADTGDVWFQFVAPRQGVYGINTLGTFDANGIDTSIAVYNACPESGPFTRLACNDDIYDDGTDFFPDSAVFVTLSAGQQVFVRIAGVFGDEGTFVFTIAPPAQNDNCDGAITIAPDTLVTHTNSGATTTFTIPNAAGGCGSFSDAGSAGVRDVFFAFTPSVTGAYRISACESDYDTTIALLTRCPLSGGITSADVIACNDDAEDTSLCAGTLQSDIESVQLSAGATVYIRVAGYNWSSATGPGFGFGTIGLRVTPLGGGGPTNVTCCRGTTCTLVPMDQCVVPPSPNVGVFLPAGGIDCNAAGVNTTPCCHADFDKAGGVTLDDIFIYLNAWFGNSPFAKMNGDGVATPTLDDLFIYLNVWFAGCP